MTLEERVTRLEKQVRVYQKMVFQLVGKARKGRPAGDMGLSRTAGQWVGLDEYKQPVERDVRSTTCDECGQSDYYDGATIQDCATCDGDYCVRCLPRHTCEYEDMEADHGEGGTAEADTGDVDATGDELVDDGPKKKLRPEGED